MTIIRTIRRLLGLDELDAEAARRLEERREQETRSAIENPERFASWEHYERFCRKHGVRPRRPERNPERDPWAGLDR